MKGLASALALTTALLGALPAAAEISDGAVKIGVLTDMSGVYSDITGKGSITAARMAVEDCLKAECQGMKIEVVSADHQNKADVGSAITREWIDRQGVDVLADMSNASLQLAIPPLLKDKNRVGLFPGGTARLTGDACQPDHVVQWMWDTYVQVAGIANHLTKPGTKWYLVTADYALGHQLEADAKTLVTAKGGTYVGSVRHAFPAVDLSSQLLTAQGSGADLIALANAGGDTVAGIKTARDFGIGQDKQKLVAFFLTAMDVKSVGLASAQGTILTEGFYWDIDERTRAFSERFKAAHGAVPSAIQAGVYSSVRHYLKAVVAAKSDEAKTVIAKMRELPIEDEVVRNAKLREDGRMVHDFYVFQVKKPAESKGEWDLYDLVATIPGDQAFRPLAQSACPAIKK
ncbi:Branched-chain amino acid transport system substrate-binding protein [Bosea sp. 62]|uniref:ABC transporter substrate-binding protein n=1 Tax=unclassified Bosea (in: a-proteobacteria) TaxID=2653178 RepID=UPI001251B5E9|nr:MULTISPECIES: ABC transporter substrate-binding protein [unclassified Bosea (in: a-proteobacteria)]CAD5286071.1 Branched-chain amino acid transport system substrate-binding protein [Bosea sp. 21B]CAD5288691.1 Branched-chain amino acid transport system substrate-binding protein [Bosea sp. 46]CAD5301356.1 Branched-chain amino acid transport system substrate-binding protein [Bosea sp. 7B]VVT60605.1 Branched-chain amino acid transport system substrate-binding protein [Bosea sp. EC-HK365B]VXB065